MYLSRLLLNLRSPEARRDLSNVHDLHRRILNAFPDANLDAPRQKYGVLFRVESSDDRLSLLVQSSSPPEWGRLPSDYCDTAFEPNPAVQPLAALIGAVRKGAHFRFRLRANATKRLRTGSDAAGKRVEVVGNDELVSWFVRKGGQNGFAVDKTGPFSEEVAAPVGFAVRAHEEPKLLGRRGGKTLTFGSTLFEGELTVTDTTAFTEALLHGIGSAKAYGFGLLSVALIRA
jgi:CRISPR system Cascade subunit CasE